MVYERNESRMMSITRDTIPCVVTRKHYILKHPVRSFGGRGPNATSMATFQHKRNFSQKILPSSIWTVRKFWNLSRFQLPRNQTFVEGIVHDITFSTSYSIKWYAHQQLIHLKETNLDQIPKLSNFDLTKSTEVDTLSAEHLSSLLTGNFRQRKVID